MTELRVMVPDEVAERLAKEAAARGSSPEDVAAEVLRIHTPEARPAPESAGAPPSEGGHRLRFIGIGHSGSQESIAQHHEQIIREHFVKKTAGDV
ncbi:MAG TPA: hypothetical protein VK277_08520 [Acidimicrobiales bacterium]|nr:hypothetical protein [Acidimicrobiales bacterium]